MTSLRARMIEDMQIRNFAANTQQSYVQQVSRFARHFNKSPELLEPAIPRLPGLSDERKATDHWFHSHRHCGPPFLVQDHPQKKLVSGRGDSDSEEASETARHPEPRGGPAVPGLRQSRKHRAILTTCYAAGLRVSEAVALTPAAIDSKRMVIRVEQGKGQRDRYVMLSPKLLDILRNWWRVERPKDWLFPGDFPGQHITRSAVEQECQKAHRIAKISKPITPHSCATPSPVTCWNKEPTSARFNSCSGIAAWPRPQNICA